MLTLVSSKQPDRDHLKISDCAAVNFWCENKLQMNVGFIFSINNYSFRLGIMSCQERTCISTVASIFMQHTLVTMVTHMHVNVWGTSATLESDKVFKPRCVASILAVPHLKKRDIWGPVIVLILMLIINYFPVTAEALKDRLTICQVYLKTLTVFMFPGYCLPAVLQ